MNKEDRSSTDVSGLHLDAELIKKSVVHANLGQELLVTTADRMRLCLLGYEKAVKAKGEWATPLATLCSLMAALVATEFRPFLTLSADAWKAIFIIGAGLSLCFVLRGLVRLLKFGRNSDVEAIIQRIKQEQ